MRYFTAPDGARLAFRDGATGPPLFCLAGLTRTGADFDYLAAQIGDEVRLIRPDYRGRGASDWTGAASYTVAQEAADAIALLDHLELDAVPALGTSRGGLIAMEIAGRAPERLSGVAFNDIGPEVAQEGLDAISGFIGRAPAARSHAEMADAMAARMTGFEGVPEDRWLTEARTHFEATPEGLAIRYDPAVRDAFLSEFGGDAGDYWSLFDCLAGKPLALIRGANSNILASDVAAEMRRRRPDMLFAEVAGRGHVPFLDEPESLATIRTFLEVVR